MHAKRHVLVEELGKRRDRALAHEGLEDAKSAYLDYRKAQELAPDWTAPAEHLPRFTVSRR